MKWEGGRRSTNIEDRRGLGVGTIGGGGIGMLLIVLAVSCLTGTNPLALLQMAEQVSPQQTQSVPTGAPSGDPQAEFVAVVLADTEETWGRVFQAGGQTLPGAGAGAVRKRRAVGVRLGIVGERPVLLPVRPEGLSRSVVLPRARSAVRRAGRLRAGVCRGPRNRPPRAAPARTRSAGRRRRGSRAAAPMPTRCQWRSSSRRIASPACGDITRKASNCWTKATSTKASRRRPRSATIA